MGGQYEDINLRKSPGLEYAMAWLKRKAPKSKKKEDDPQWWALLDTCKLCVEGLSQGAAFREGDEGLEAAIAARHAVELELDCLIQVAKISKGSVEEVLNDMTGSKKVSKLRGDGDDEEGDPFTPTNLELVLGVKKYLAEHLSQEAKNADAAKTIDAALALVVQDLDQGPASEMQEANSLANILSHPPLTCFKCGATVGSKVDPTVLMQMRT